MPRTVILEAASPITLNAAIQNPLVLMSGTFKLSNSASDITAINTNGTLPQMPWADGKRVWATGGTINAGNYSWRLNGGELRITAVMVNVGKAPDNRTLDLPEQWEPDHGRWQL